MSSAAGYHGRMPHLTVRYFAAAAEAAGVDEETWDLGTAPTLGELRRRLSERYGAAMDRVLRAGSFLVDGVVRRDDGPVLDDAMFDSPVLDDPAREGSGSEIPAPRVSAANRSETRCTVDVLPPFAGG